jgi:hypothetical protein
MRQTCSVLGAVLLVGIVGCDNKSGKDSMNVSGDGSAKMSQPTTSPSATTYTCTIHPDVVQSQPGKCPKCGMSLVAKK